MKFRALHVLCICVLAAAWIACGAGHPTITHLTVAPQMGTAPVSPPTDVQYTATATFSNNTNRELSVADGLTWSSSNTSIATISDNGSATCIAVGQVTITAKAPTELNITVNNGIDNTSPKITGTAQLTCNAM
ncbi:MAG TPA: Ig-like domain-containing protein [Candidatus Binatia bacterium]|nr:Ig-like domain-containing protein [Candidatus Binatia bacterium]